MKKNTFAKILAGVIILAAVIAGAFVIYRKFFCKEFEEELEDFSDDEADEAHDEEIKREYVSIPFEETTAAESADNADDNNAE